MMTVLDIRGTSGSGKSWIVHKILEKYNHSPILSKEETRLRIIGYEVPKLDLMVVGRYIHATGGCDSLKEGGLTRLVEIVRTFAEIRSSVVLEGLRVSHIFKRFHELAGDLPDYTFMFLDTPLDKCIWRVEQRRAAKGNKKTFDPEKNLIPEYNRIMTSVKPKLVEAGHCVKTLDHRKPLSAVIRELKDAMG